MPYTLRRSVQLILTMLFLSFGIHAQCAEIVISDQNSTVPVFSKTGINLTLEKLASINVVDDDAVMIRGRSSVTLLEGASISVDNTISEGVGIHILDEVQDDGNFVSLGSGVQIKVDTVAISSDYTYSDMQTKSYMPLFPEFTARDSLVLNDIDSPYASVDYDAWEQNNIIDSYNLYPNAAARGIVLEGPNSPVNYGADGELITEMPPPLFHFISLNNASVFVSASASCDGCWAEAHGVHVDLPEASNSVVELSLYNSHITAEAISTGGNGYYDLEYVYGDDVTTPIPSSSNAVGVYASSDILINVDGTSSISGDWAIWGNPGQCIGWYHG